MAGRADVEAGRAFVRLFVKDDMTKSLRNALRKVNDGFTQLANSAMSAGATLTAVGVSIAAPIALSLKTFASFSDSMAAAGAVSNATTAQLAAMTAQAKELGRTTSYTASQIAGLQTELGRAGFKPEEIVAATTAIQDLGRATNTDLAKAAEIAGATLRQFNLTASESTRVADVLAATANNSAQTVEDLGEAFSYVGPVATDAGLSIEQTATALGVLANLGLKGSMGGTSLRRVILAFADPKVQEQLRGMGVRAVDAAGNLRPVADTLLDLGKAMTAMPNAERLSLMQSLFDLRGMTAGMKLSTSADDLERMAAAIADSGGAAQRTAKKMDDTLGGTFRMVMSAVEGVAIAFGEQLTPALRKLEGPITKSLEWFTKFISANPQAVQWIASFAAGTVAAGGALLAAGAAATGIVAVISALTALAGVASGLAALAPVIGGIALGLASATSALYLLDTAGVLNMGRVLDAARETGDYLSGQFTDLWGNWASAASTATGGVLDALEQGEWQMAADIAMAGVESVVAHSIVTMTSMWNDYKQAVLEALLGSVQIAVDAMKKLSALGGPFAGMIGGGAAGQATGIIGGILNNSRNNKEASLQAAQAQARAADQRLANAAQRPNEFVEDFAPDFVENFLEDFVEEIPPPGQMERGIGIWRDWLQKAAGAAQQIAKTDIPLMGASFGDLAEAVGAPSDIMAALGLSKTRWQEQLSGGPSVTPIRATYSAAAAQAQGFGIGGDDPQKQMATSLFAMRKTLEELGVLAAKQDASNQQVVSMYERFLAAFSYS